MSAKEEFKPKASLRSAIVAVVLTDLAFSLDSISAAVAISDRFLVIIVGCGIGVLALSFLADLFQVWMEKFVYLELSGYLAIALVATKLIAEIINPALVVPELFVRLVDRSNNKELARYELSGTGYAGMTAITLAEIYRHNGEWKMSVVGNDLKADGLKDLVASYT